MFFNYEKKCGEECQPGVPFDLVQGWGVLWEDLDSDITLLQALQPNDELANGVLSDIGVYYNGWEIELPSSDQVFIYIRLSRCLSLPQKYEIQTWLDLKTKAYLDTCLAITVYCRINADFCNSPPYGSIQKGVCRHRLHELVVLLPRLSQNSSLRLDEWNDSSRLIGRGLLCTIFCVRPVLDHGRCQRCW